MRTFKDGRLHAWSLVPVGLLALAMAVTWPVGVDAAGQGLRVKINAQNRSTADTSWCGNGVGNVGDKLTADVSMDLEGVVTGTVRYRPASGSAVIFDIWSIFSFSLEDGKGGVALSGTEVGGDALDADIVIWLNQASAPTSVTIEYPAGGCENTLSTFTAGADKLSAQITVRGGGRDNDD